MQKRLKAAVEEIEVGRLYKDVVINDEVKRAVAAVRAVLAAEKRLVGRNEELFDEMEKGREE